MLNEVKAAMLSIKDDMKTHSTSIEVSKEQKTLESYDDPPKSSTIESTNNSSIFNVFLD